MSATTPKKVTIVGSGNWGSAIARIVGKTVKEYADTFQERVPMWVYEEVCVTKIELLLVILRIFRWSTAKS